MPTYEYRCAANGAVVEVQHKMADQLHTWAELCDRAGIARGKTAPSAPVVKLMSAGFVRTASASGEAACEAPMYGNGACGGGMCGMS